MDILCKICGRAYVDGEWTDDAVPIQRVSKVICPDCQDVERLEKRKRKSDDDDEGGMVYQQKKRDAKKKSKSW